MHPTVVLPANRVDAVRRVLSIIDVQRPWETGWHVDDPTLEQIWNARLKREAADLRSVFYKKIPTKPGKQCLATQCKTLLDKVFSVALGMQLAKVSGRSQNRAFELRPHVFADESTNLDLVKQYHIHKIALLDGQYPPVDEIRHQPEF